MRATFDLPENLIQEAMVLTQSKTETQAIVKALEQLIGKSKISELKKFKGKIDLDLFSV